MFYADRHYWNTLQIPRTSLLLTLLREEKTKKAMAFGNSYSSWKRVYYLAIGLMVILAGVNFYMHLLAPYTIQSSITLSTGKVSITLSMRGMEGLHLICIILKFKRVFPELLKLVEFLKINKFPGHLSHLNSLKKRKIKCECKFSLMCNWRYPVNRIQLLWERLSEK